MPDDRDDRDIWIGLALGVVLGVALWALIIWLYVNAAQLAFTP